MKSLDRENLYTYKDTGRKDQCIQTTRIGQGGIVVGYERDWGSLWRLKYVVGF